MSVNEMAQKFLRIKVAMKNGTIHWFGSFDVVEPQWLRFADEFVVITDAESGNSTMLPCADIDEIKTFVSQ